MNSPLRIEYAIALYHVTSRGNERKSIYREESDFNLFLDALADICDRFNWTIKTLKLNFKNRFQCLR